MQYQDLFEMIADVLRSIAAGDQVVNMDNPMSRHLGYQGLTQEWTISLFDVKRIWSQREGWTQDQADSYSKIKTAEGRLEVVYSKPCPKNS